MPYGFNDAKAKAEEVGGSCYFRYDQGLDIRSIVGGGEVSSGWCHAVTIMWIKKNFAGADFLEWFGPAEKACPERRGKGATVGPVFVELKTMMTEQSELISAFNAQANKSWWAVDYALVRNVTRYGMTPAADGVSSFEINKSAVLMVDMLSGSRGYNYVRLHGDAAAHGIGVYVSDQGDSFTLFDPNFGQYNFPSKDTFVAFLKQFMPKSGYGAMFKRMGILNITAVA